jgi:hypothetical protein
MTTIFLFDDSFDRSFKSISLVAMKNQFLSF